MPLKLPLMDAGIFPCIIPQSMGRWWPNPEGCHMYRYEHKNNGTSQSKGLFEMWEVLIGKGIRGVSEYFEGKGTSWMSEMDRTKAVGINADNLIFSDVNPCPKFVGL